MHEYDQEIFEDCAAMMGDERVPVELNALIRWAGSYYRYPLQFGDMLKGMHPLILTKCITGLLAAQLRNKIAPWEPRDCEEALIQLYGKPLYEFFFREFTTRYWGMPPTQISAMFVKRKMPRLTAVDAIKKMLAAFGLKDAIGKSTGSALLEETLSYSQTGAETLPRSIANQIKEDGGKVFTNRTIHSLGLDRGHITSVTVKNETTGTIRDIPCDHCISTIPVNTLLDLIKPAPKRPIINAAKHLRYLPIVIFGLLVKKEKAINALYVYYRERIFHRVGEPKNAGLKVTPEGHTVLIVELTCREGDATWNGEDSVKEKMYADLEFEGICTRNEIVELHHLRYAHGYPIFDLGYEPHHQTVLDYLGKIKNLQSTGRQGGFCFPGMHTAMRMGANAATKVLAH
jgi:protoporphyrinogen oxidase